ncbi:hypothetical protein [Paraflavitalea pollutisoli]|uniref:hypothetical protein n=1 Tax=Paraflavitalea pollutisoli TaxID=3034143 RepID=UPI0023ED3571|nr:hypothetical protein [Paraflavitalea sp. H1-2-19X]
MKTTKAARFWAWFRRNQHHFLGYDELAPAAQAYWMAELEVHMAAYDRHLEAFLACSDDRVHKLGRLLITAHGRAKSFKAADRLVNKAPRLAAWYFESLISPVSVAAGIREELAEAGLDGESFWFDVRNSLTFRKPFLVFVDVGRDAHDDLDIMAEQAVFNVLGERMFGERVECVHFIRFSDLLPENKAFLAPLGELRDFLKARELSGMVVGWDGELIKSNSP